MLKKNNLKIFLFISRFWNVPKSIVLSRKHFANASLQDRKKSTNERWTVRWVEEERGLEMRHDQRFNVKFTNKVKPRPVKVKTIHKQHQIHLLDMKIMKVKYKGKSYLYILSLLDIFSRFHRLVPLEKKRSIFV